MEINIDFLDLEKSLITTRKKAAGLSILRLILFFLIVIAFTLGLSDWKFLLLLPLLCALFIYMILRFNEQKDHEAYILELIKMAENKKNRAERNLADFEAGEEYLEKSHSFANDLDLFGQHSLFQLINHTVTSGGRRLLVKWMKSDISPIPAKKRHLAIQDLRTKENFIEKFEGFGRAFIGKEKSKSSFYKWLAEESTWKKMMLFPMVIGPLGGLGVILACLYLGLSTAWLGIWILLGMSFLSLIHTKMQQAAFAMPNQGDLKTFRLWAALLEIEQFESSMLKDIQSPFITKDFNASTVLKSLEQKSFMIQNRFNLIYLIFNLLFWIDFYFYWRLSIWKNRYGKHLENWEKNFEEWQVLISLAAFANEESLKGTIQWTEDDQISVKQICHPLIHPKKAIPNDFALTSEQKIVLLTGANMSGKTTFMRTLGINIVLANLGLNPFSKTFKLGNFQLFTSMRNTDNLGESVSSFYAELARIKNLLEKTASGIRVLFLLDEILKGTNTTDRIIGSEALIRQLAEAGGKGIISTHDIELSKLELSLNYLVNKSFHSEIDRQEIHFDYLIKDGPCPSFNAHKLMELMGIRF